MKNIELDKLVIRLQQIQESCKEVTHCEAVALISDNSEPGVYNHMNGWAITLKFINDKLVITNGLLYEGNPEPKEALN